MSTPTIPENELHVSVIDRRPPGGQTVGDQPTTVEVTHIPTGLVARCGADRSQYRNRKVAVAMIEWGLAEMGWPR